MNHTVAAELPRKGYRHEAFFYAGIEQFLAGTLAFIREALAAEEPILVVLSRAKIDLLSDELGGDARRVCFADMADVGLNPARIIPAWLDFVERHAAQDRRLWGIGEPIWAGRSAPELAECERHEALLNVVFSDPQFTLLCPYDTGVLDASVIAEALRNHPFVRKAGASLHCPSFAGAAALAEPFDDPLPAVPAHARSLRFQTADLRAVRRVVAAEAACAGLSAARSADLVLAVNEIATNSLLHGGGHGTLWAWSEPEAVICEVHDAGRIEDPLVGRRRPPQSSSGGRGLWLANQLCELVQVRTFATHGAVRLYMRRPSIA